MEGCKGGNYSHPPRKRLNPVYLKQNTFFNESPSILCLGRGIKEGSVSRILVYIISILLLLFLCMSYQESNKRATTVIFGLKLNYRKAV